MDAYKIAIMEALDRLTTKYEIGPAIIEDFRKFLLEAGREYMSDMPNRRVHRKRATGYNEYVSYMFQATKESGDNRGSQEKMTEFSRAWKDLDKADKRKFEEQAARKNSSQETNRSVANTRKLSGYNLFYLKNTQLMKDEAREAGIKMMTYIASRWNELTPDQKQEWNESAKSYQEDEEDDEEDQEQDNA